MDYLNLGLYETQYLTIEQALAKDLTIKNKKVVVIGGGMTGIETAEHFAVMGNEVTVVEMQSQLAPEVNVDSKRTVLENLNKYNANILLSHKLIEMREGKIIAEDLESNRQVEVEADYIILSLGKRVNRTLGEELKELYDKVYFVGDALQIGRIANAVHLGFERAYVLE